MKVRNIIFYYFSNLNYLYVEFNHTLIIKHIKHKVVLTNNKNIVSNANVVIISGSQSNLPGIFKLLYFLIRNLCL